MVGTLFVISSAQTTHKEGYEGGWGERQAKSWSVACDKPKGPLEDTTVMGRNDREEREALVSCADGR